MDLSESAGAIEVQHGHDDPIDRANDSEVAVVDKGAVETRPISLIDWASGALAPGYARLSVVAAQERDSLALPLPARSTAAGC